MLERLDGVMAVRPDGNRELWSRGCVEPRDHLEVREPTCDVDAERRCAACGTVGLPHERMNRDVTALVSAWGRLIADPELRTTEAGKARAGHAWPSSCRSPTARMKTPTRPTLWLSITAIGQTAETLACRVRGECLFIAGRLEMRPSKSRGGEPARAGLASPIARSAHALRVREVTARASPATAAQRSGRRQPRTRRTRLSVTPSCSESDR